MSAWQRVEAEAARLKTVHLRDLAARPGRAEAMAASLDDLTLDLCREALDTAALDALLALAEAEDVTAKRDAAFAGEPVNATEGRAVLHMALRGGAAAPEGDDPAPTLEAMLAFAGAVRSGEAEGQGGRYTDVLNIGIGGSDLGPVMAVRALAPDHDGPRVHFVSNVDGAHLADTIRGLDPARTLILVASKTFTTLETMTNARSARDWLVAGGVAEPGRQMAALSTNIEGAADFGIPPERVFGFWDWVGGRYSVWSAIGLSLAIAIGPAGFRAFLDGAAAMDRHFREAPLGRNLPVLLALVGIWRRVMGHSAYALIPYDQRLERFPAYVQQLEMESNGKSVTLGGEAVGHATSPVVWGEPGTNAQHSFFQLLHQGSDIVPVDLILAAEPRDADPHHHDLLVANALAQAQALAFGRTEAEVRDAMAAKGADGAEIDRLAPHRVFPGNRPSTLITHRRLDPHALGRLIALYEHKVMVQGFVWGINSFDQWGVELGKALAGRLIPAVKGEAEADDPGIAAAIARLSALRAGA